MIVFLLKDELSTELRSKWEEERKGSHEPASLKTFLDFLETRHKILSAMPRRAPTKITHNDPRGKPIKTFATIEESIKTEPVIENDEESTDEVEFTLFNKRQEICGICSVSHRVFTCPIIKQNTREALALIKARELCINCLYKHNIDSCTSKFRCKRCEKKHNTLLHDVIHELDIHMTNIHQTLHSTTHIRRALLAMVIHTPEGDKHLRALIDPGSTTNLLSERGAQIIKCKRERIPHIPMFGVGNTPTGTVSTKTTILIGSLYNNTFQWPINAYITPTVTAVRQISTNTISKWTHLEGLQLADPKFLEGGIVDILIGVNTYADLLESGLIRGQPNEPVAQKTKIGWILAGAYDSEELINFNKILSNIEQTSQNEEILSINTITNDDLAKHLKKFWETEEANLTTKNWSEAEQECEDYFVKTIRRAPDGKLVMRLPFNSDANSPDFLGDSLRQATYRFYQLERRLERNLALKKEYANCINEYIELKHAIEVPMEKYKYIIPHHAVVKESSTTTKTRVVYDASSPTTNGYSLNDRMHIGPPILEDIWKVLLRWRMGKIALTADIEKMYRQFWVDERDTPFQQILWRNNSSEPLKLYELKTVTFGTAGAPFLAIRGLHYIADYVSQENPDLTEIIKKCFYVDDFLKAVDTIEEAIYLKEKITSLFSSFGLNLRKWNSNAPEILTEEAVGVKILPQETTTALGMQWITSTDSLSFKITVQDNNKNCTKRNVLAQIASLYDPLGLLAPIIMRAKVFMQQLWLGKFGWDEELPMNLSQEWDTIKISLQKSASIKIPRWAGYENKNHHASLHGFCDASETAYAATLYLRTVTSEGKIHVNLLTAKTKVAPLKRIAIPRLELCAAQLLTD